MKPSDDTGERTSAPPDCSNTNDDAATGLPLFRTWRSVYVFVLGCFVLYVVLLAILTRAFS